MKALVVACCQLEALPGRPADNVTRMLEAARRAAEAGARIVVYPELILTGYLPPERIAPLAMELGDPAITRLREAARELELALVFGFPERAATGVCHDSQAYVRSDGTLAAVYRKIHLFGTEGDWARPGDHSIVTTLDTLTVGGWICYDTRFPELARSQAAEGALLALVSTAWLGPGEEWELALRARALDNGIFVAGADIVDPTLGCRGRSMIVDPAGAVIARARLDAEDLITAALDPEVMTRQRARVPLLEHRRPEVYARPPRRTLVPDPGGDPA